MINEGGAMPGVGAIHIDEINSTLNELEKSIGVEVLVRGRYWNWA